MTQVQPNTQNYRILGADQNATLEELKSAYHRAAKKTHPDLAIPAIPITSSVLNSTAKDITSSTVKTRASFASNSPSSRHTTTTC